MKNIGILVAMPTELDLFAGSLENLNIKNINPFRFFCGSIDYKNIVVAQSGMGKVNAALCCQTLIREFSPDVIVHIGISGGLDSSLKIGDFVIGKDLVYHDVWCWEPNQYGQIQDMPASYYSDPKLVEKFKEYPSGLFCCGDRFISDKNELASITQHFPHALAVDMESTAVAQTCYLHNIPLLSIRQISDTPGIDNHMDQYEAFWKNAPKNSCATLKNILKKI